MYFGERICNNYSTNKSIRLLPITGQSIATSAPLRLSLISFFVIFKIVWKIHCLYNVFINIAMVKCFLITSFSKCFFHKIRFVKTDAFFMVSGST